MQAPAVAVELDETSRAPGGTVLSVAEELDRAIDRHLSLHPGVPLGAPTLLHAVFLDLVGRGRLGVADRAAFLAAAAPAIRRLVRDGVRRQVAAWLDGRFAFVSPGPGGVGAAGHALPGGMTADTVDRLAGALDHLGRTEPFLMRVVDLHFFGGCPLEEIAAAFGDTEPAVREAWRRARSLLGGVAVARPPARLAVGIAD